VNAVCEPGPSGSLMMRVYSGVFRPAVLSILLAVEAATGVDVLDTGGEARSFGEDDPGDEPNILSLARRYFSSRSCRVCRSLFVAAGDCDSVCFGRLRIRIGGSNASSGGNEEPSNDDEEPAFATDESAFVDLIEPDWQSSATLSQWLTC
jgi:hypothetical protein